MLEPTRGPTICDSLKSLYELADRLSIPEDLLAESIYTALDFDKRYILFYPCTQDKRIRKVGMLIRLCFDLEDVYGYELVGFVLVGNCNQYKELYIEKLAYVYMDNIEGKCIIITSEEREELRNLFAKGRYRWCYQLLDDMREVREYL
ncbi:MAG TPA: hypothetical protein EYP08_01090 [Pyrodictiaceae archaeon]|nr:hypothetical protein [Pyrodictiaceae archaeon]HIQ56237.1 hypothetical protein [Pyrodictium sp.]